MANNPNSQDKLRELAPRFLSRKDIVTRAKYGAAMGARANPAVEQWFISREAEQAKRKASELVMTAMQRPEPAEQQVQQQVSELAVLREEEIMNREQDILATDARRKLAEVWNPGPIQEGRDEFTT